MKKLINASIIFILFSSCTNNKANKLNNRDKCNFQNNKSIPINYDSKSLRLNLLDKLSSSKSKSNWKWDYMNSDNGLPDTLGVEYYMNISQSLFLFNGEKTLPFLSIKTCNDQIIEFSATTIFHLKQKDSINKRIVLDSLKNIELLNSEKIKNELQHSDTISNNTERYIEQIIFKYGIEDSDYDKIVYNIKLL